jgi:hypothetical protein
MSTDTLRYMLRKLFWKPRWSYWKSLGKPFLAIVGSVIAMLTVVGVVLPFLPATQQAVVASWRLPPLPWYGWLILLQFVALSLGAEAAYRKQRTTTRFFGSRSDFEGIREELLSSKDVWAIWPAGYIIPTLGFEHRSRLRRLILGSPLADDAALAMYAADYIVGSIEHVREIVKEATRTAIHDGAVVRWHTDRSLSLVIREPQAKAGGSARLELLIPFIAAHQRPSVVITQNEYPEVFANLVGAFEKRWSQAIEPTPLQLMPTAKTSPATRSNRVEIVSARWGALDTWADVTRTVQAHAMSGAIDIQVVNEVLGIDPLKGHRKALKLEYSIDGQPRPTLTVEEKGRLKLP